MQIPSIFYLAPVLNAQKTACKIFSMADWKVGRQTLITCPELDDIPYCYETLIKEAIQNSYGILKERKKERACPVPKGFGGKRNNKVVTC